MLLYHNELVLISTLFVVQHGSFVNPYCDSSFNLSSVWYLGVDSYECLHISSLVFGSGHSVIRSNRASNCWAMQYDIDRNNKNAVNIITKILIQNEKLDTNLRHLLMDKLEIITSVLLLLVLSELVKDEPRELGCTSRLELLQLGNDRVDMT